MNELKWPVFHDTNGKAPLPKVADPAALLKEVQADAEKEAAAAAKKFLKSKVDAVNRAKAVLANAEADLATSLEALKG